MIAMEAKVRKWGHSLGLVIPRDKVRMSRIRVGENVQVLVTKKTNVLREVFGTLKFKEPTEKMMKDIDKLLYND